MATLDKEYIKQTLKEEKFWKVGEVDSFSFNGWELTLRKEKEVNSPFNYLVSGYNENGASIDRRYKTMEDAFLHILNRFNENANIKNRYDNLKDIL
ncbi:hypothetical protein ACP8H2_09825 [Bacillus subtilis]|uniref:hypothetical protein n=1 Tax=Bacillus subtilis TaxID=1423 RepID=UPI003CEB2DCE